LTLPAETCRLVPMPKPNGPRWLHRRCELEIPRAVAADKLGLSEGSLRNIEGGHDPVRLEVIYRATRLYGLPYSELVADSEVGPDGRPKGPAARKPRKKNSKRAASKGAAA
jgi:hypothetical protein